MTFKEEMVSTFTSSMSFLVDSMMETLSYVSRDNIVTSKPSHTVQTEKFFSFYEKLMASSETDRQVLVDNLRNKVVSPVYDKYSLNFLNHLVTEEGKVEDAFLKISAQDRDSLKIRTVPDGLYFQISKVFLPVSEVYTEAVKVSLQKKGENLPFPNKILLGLYSVVYHAISDRLDRDMMNYFTENIKTLKESLDVCDEVKQKPVDQGPMGLIKNMLGNIDFNQIGDMMAKVSGDEKSSKEFGEVFGKLSDTIKNGGNPLDVMGDIIKQATMDAAEHMEEAPAEDSTDTGTVAQEPGPVETTTETTTGTTTGTATEEVTDIAEHIEEMTLPPSGI